jgi:hypothetical protein
MTIKAIREALKDYSRITGKADDAMAQLKAVSIVAKDLAAHGWIDDMANDGLEHAADVLAAIAEDEG